MSSAFGMLASCLSVAACAAGASRATSSPPPDESGRPSGAASSSLPAPTAPAPAETPSTHRAAVALDVTERSGSSNSFDERGRSDLPDPVPSAARPYAELVETAVAPLRPALGECFRPVPTPTAPRFYAISVATDGAVHPCTPQPAALRARVAGCAEAVLDGTTVNPTPPRPFAFEVFLTPDRSR